MPIRPELPNLEDLSAAELRSLAVSLLGTVAQLEAKVAALSEEIARLKRLKGRPNLKPSGMEKGTDTWSNRSDATRELSHAEGQVEDCGCGAVKV